MEVELHTFAGKVTKLVKQSGDIWEEMNRMGSESIPFLFMVDFEMHQPLVIPLKELPAGVEFSTPRHPVKSDITKAGDRVLFSKEPVSFEEYSAAFETVMRHLKHGDSYLVNLTFATRISTSLTMQEIFRRSTAPYRLRYGQDLVVFSPEPFVHIRDGRISSYPMKGTIDASLPDAERCILNDPKEMAEHATIVDLIRNDLSMVSWDVRVKRFRYIEKICTHEKEILQVSSEIEGRLAANYTANLGSLMRTLLPAGSISGAPKKKTVEIIREAEKVPRGYFTGVFGVFDGSGFESAVMIRYIEQRNGALWFRSGGGITHQSDPASEYQEMIDKVYVTLT